LADFWTKTQGLWEKVETLDEVVDLIIGFREYILKKCKIKLRPYQVEISNKLIRMVVYTGMQGKEATILQARQSGKTETVADTVLILGLFYIGIARQTFTCGLFAPVESMITHVTRNRLRDRYYSIRTFLLKKGIKLTAGMGVTSSLFILRSTKTLCEARVRSLSAGESAKIIGETFQLMIVEQSELISPVKLKNDIFPMGAESGGVRILTGTTSPYLVNDYFRKAIDQWNPDPRKNASTSDYVRIVDWIEASKYSKKYRRYVEDERKKLKPESIEFRTQYALEWAGLRVKFTTWEDLALQEIDYQPVRERLRFYGIDVAKAGDSTVVTIIEIDGTSIHIIAWLELEGIDYEVQVEKIVRFLRKYAPLRYGLIDSVAMGQVVYDMLKKRLFRFAPIEDYYGSKQSNDDMYKTMDREFIHDRVFYPKDTRYRREKNKFLEQMIDLERTYQGSYLKLHHPKVKGRHDDYPQSLALAIYAFEEKQFTAGATII